MTVHAAVTWSELEKAFEKATRLKQQAKELLNRVAELDKLAARVPMIPPYVGGKLTARKAQKSN